MAINYGGTLDLTNNAILVNASDTSLSTIQGLVVSGFNSGAWTGSGIISSEVVANSPGGSNYSNDDFNGAKTVGFASAAVNNSVPSGDIEAMYTEAADFTLNGVVNVSDYLALQGHYLQTGQTFQNGDANFDGTVDLSDYLILQGEYLSQVNASGNGL